MCCIFITLLKELFNIIYKKNVDSVAGYQCIHIIREFMHLLSSSAACFETYLLIIYDFVSH